jgi:hypothetical protein
MSRRVPMTNVGYGRGLKAPTAMGRFVLLGTLYRFKLAHRLSYEIHKGPIPPTANVVRHSCDTPLCVNPNHLYAGTQADNLADMDAKGRRRTGSRVGAMNGRAVVTPDDVHKIRQSDESYAKLAKTFGVSRGTIASIVKRRNWSHLDLIGSNQTWQNRKTSRPARRVAFGSLTMTLARFVLLRMLTLGTTLRLRISMRLSDGQTILRLISRVTSPTAAAARSSSSSVTIGLLSSRRTSLTLNDIDPSTGRPRPLLLHREHVIKAGEIASVPGEEADKLIEAGVARQHKEKKE